MKFLLFTLFKAIGKSAVDSWYAEKKDYFYATGTWKNGTVVGHFTQVVWDDSKQIGCGISFNNNLCQVTVSCNYVAQGNWVGQYQFHVIDPTK